ncbi:hypothetical protein E2986_13145 [Frieseomelitta varia]|uniref:Uncharacterized protein n=1 Tax=Frieseomelitta varia TaxID=561572 RepID=A0A833RZH1_9HYME|nr:hypothetical protein E2986_13145 [Frieseomelitta varia]
MFSILPIYLDPEASKLYYNLSLNEIKLIIKFDVATSPVSCLTPPPEVTTIHAMEQQEVVPIVGVQDASNQTDAPEPEDQEQQQQQQQQPLLEACVKQEQSLSPCQLQNSATNLTQTTTTNLTNLTNFEIVAASPEKVCNVVRITTTTTTVNPAVCSLVGKVDKAENTVINMADCPKYSVTKECRSVTSIDRTIEHVVTQQIDREHDDRNHLGDEKSEEQLTEDRVPCRDIRNGPRIIEITEENCDSFHENLEFFGSRRDHSLDRLRDRKNNYVHESVDVEMEEEIDAKAALPDKIEIPKIEERPPIESNRHASTMETSEAADRANKLSESNGQSRNRMEIDGSYQSLEKNRDERPEAPLPRPQITVKSFDMPSIDCDDQVAKPIVIKQEADETASYDDFSSATEKSRCQDSSKKHATEKSHPGIENVVEKLKKNAAAALQETTFQKVDDPKDKNAEDLRSRRHSEPTPTRRLENGLKKHILKSCENSQFLNNYPEPVSRETEVSSSEASRVSKDSQDVANHERPCDFSMSKYPVPRKCFLNQNSNNDKPIEHEDTVVKKESVSSPESCEAELMNCTEDVETTVSSAKRKLEISDQVNAYATVVCDDESSKSARNAVNLKQKPVVDISGLELLSNSIEQLEQLKPPNTQNVAAATTELERASARATMDSPLGLLCALAEQRFMEEMGDEVINLENSEEISHAGRLLLNLGRMNVQNKEMKPTEKRKYEQGDSQGCESLKKLKIDGEAENDGYDSLRYEDRNNGETYGEQVQEEFILKAKAKTRSANLSEKNYANDNEDVDMLEDASLDRNTSQNESFEQNERQYLMNGTYSNNRSIDHHFSDLDDEMYDQRMSPSDKAAENNEDSGDAKSRISMEHRHDYRNLQAKLDAKKFLARKGHTDNNEDWPDMDAMELHMRVQLADIQRQYKEKQKELSKLTPKKDEKKSPGRPRKKSHSSSSDPTASPSTSEQTPSPQKSPLPEEPTTSATSTILAMSRCNVNLIKLDEQRSHIKLLDSIPSIPMPVAPVASPILPSSKSSQDDDEKSTGRVNTLTENIITGTQKSKKTVKRKREYIARHEIMTRSKVKKLEKLENEKLEKEKLEKEKLEKEKLEKEKLEKEKLEKEKLEKEKLEKEKLEKEKLENEKLENEKLEKEKLETEKLENEKKLENEISIKN